ncbi:Retrovirus-related Pol polyprotein from transposon TNT 1-94 [Bienertia sinuspersici]
MGDDGKLDPASPFYLGAGDQPGNLITHVILKADNYLPWSRAITLSLKSRRKFGFVDGTISKPSEKKKLLDWETVNSMLVSWLLRSIDPKLAVSIPFFDEAKKLWNYLEKRYCVANGPRLQQLRAAITDCRQSKGMSVQDYYTKLMGLYDDLARLKLPHICECGQCTCDVAGKYEKDKDEEVLHQFLIGIDDDLYALVRTNLLSQQPPATLDRAYEAFLQEERSRGIARTKVQPERDDARVIAVNSDRPKSSVLRRDKSKLHCTHCQRTGHDADGCFLIHGYPEWWVEKYGTKGAAASRPSAPTTASVSAQPSTAASAAARGRSATTPPVRAHAVADGSAPISAVPTASAVDDGAALSSLSELKSEHVQILLNMINGQQQDRMIGKSDSLSWILDIGASHHVTGDESSLMDVTPIFPCPVGLPDGVLVNATKEGRVSLAAGLILEHVLFVPQLTCNLISVSKMIDDSYCYVRFTNTLCAIQDQRSGSLIGGGERIDGLYYFRRIPKVCVVQSPEISTFELWHRRLGHPSDKVVKLLPAVSNSSSSKFLHKACDICPQAKQSRDSFPNSDNKATRIFEMIHCDLWGPYKTPSTCGAHYFLTIVDDFSRGVWVYLLADKTEVYASFNSFFAMVKTQFEVTVKYVRSDNGTEFKPMIPYFDDHGILFQTSCVGTPQQNGRVERKHQHIMNVARALRFQGHLPIGFWGECVLGAVYLINHTPSRLLANKTPFEILFNKPPNFDDMRVFGCLCFAHNQKSKGDKFASRSRKCVFVGYPYGKKGWKVYDLESGNIMVSRDVQFHENEFPFASMSDLTSETDDYNNVGVDFDFLDDLENVLTVGEAAIGRDCSDGGDRSPTIPPPVVSSPAVEDTSVSTTAPQAASGEGAPVVLARSDRSRHPPGWHHDYIAHTVHVPSPSTTSSPPSSSSSTPYPLAHFVNCDTFSLRHRVFIAALDAGVEPCTFKEAMKHEGWRAAMQKEITALEDNETWVMQELPPGKKALGSKWVYKIKHNSDGTVERLKARLVIYGNHQVEGIDYNETFAPVAKMVTVRAFLAIAAAKNWELHQMDVHNAFLHGDLDEEVYMRPPPGFHGSAPGLVCRLQKSLYGLRQAPRCWFAKLASALKRYGFVQSYSDYSLFTMTSGDIQLSILVYVDDLIISGNNSSAISAFKEYLSSCFHMKDLGLLKYFLGIEVARSNEGIFLCQRKYTLDIIAETGLLGARPATFPIEQNHTLATADGPLLTDPEIYRRLVGRLIYLSFTRPDLAYTVHILAQFMQTPRQQHWEAALRCVRYLKGSPGQGILLGSDCDLQLAGWCDSDWASYPLTRRSLTGWLVFLGGSPISWKTKKQHTVSRSSAEAEYRSMATLTAELKWLKALLQSLGVAHPKAMRLYCDSQSALYIAQNPVFHERTKHIEVDCHYIRDAIQDGIIRPSHVKTDEQLADIFTKALGKKQFLYLLGKLGICDLHAPT